MFLLVQFLHSYIQLLFWLIITQTSYCQLHFLFCRMHVHMPSVCPIEMDDCNLVKHTQ